MLFILQRYYFESESQQIMVRNDRKVGCCLSYKDTILKANHNTFENIDSDHTDVVYPTKILF